MPLSDAQRATLTTEAQRRGIDPAKLIAAAESNLTPDDDEPDGSRTKSTEGEQPKLFMYLLPFVTVREVRQKWLGLTESFSGDGEVASKWAAKQGGETPKAGDPATE